MDLAPGQHRFRRLRLAAGPPGRLRAFVRHVQRRPRATEAQRLAELLTREEAERVDRLLAVGIQEADRLAAVGAAEELAGDDRTRLQDQLAPAWRRLDGVRDAVDHAGCMMANTCTARLMDYVRWSRRLEAFTGIDPRCTDRSAEAS